MIDQQLNLQPNVLVPYSASFISRTYAIAVCLTLGTSSVQLKTE